MAYSRQKKVELDWVASGWDGCFILVKTKGFLEVQEYSKKTRKISRDLDRLSIKIKKLNKKIDQADVVDDLLVELDKLEDKEDKTSDSLLNFMLQVVKESFISGIIYDGEKQRDLKKEEIGLLDIEIIKEVFNSILGNIEKKD